MNREPLKKCVICGKMISSIEPKIKIKAKDGKWHFIHSRCWKILIKGGDKSGDKERS